MPAYNTSNTGNLTDNPVLPSVLWPGDDIYLFGLSYVAASGPTPGQIQAANDANVLFETVTVNERSISVALAPRPGGGSAPGIMVQVFANAAPGAAEIDVQDAAVDADGAYLTPNNTAYKLTAWTQLGGSAIYTAWTELQPEGGRFMSLKCIANPNAVKFTAKVSYV
jgi:hypothetical protein